MIGYLAADSIAHPIRGCTSSKAYSVYSDHVAMRRSTGPIVARNGGSRWVSRFARRTTAKTRISSPNGRWIANSNG